MSSITRGIAEEFVAQLISMTDPEPDRPGLKDTPKRFAKAWEFWTSGYREDPHDILKDFEDGAENYNEMVFQGSLPFYSLCEHHVTPFFGIAHIGYIPDGHIIGLSKFGRLLDCFSRRLQVQERLTQQIAHALMKEMKPKGCGVVLKARHLCVESRGVQKIGTTTTTSELKGIFLSDGEVREEFFSFVRGAADAG
jgi:GTP cyclohydrolase I